MVRMFPRPQLTPLQRSRALLFSLLTEEQRQVADREDYIPVTGSTGGRWRIYLNRMDGNCLRIDRFGNAYKRYCAHLPAEWYVSESGRREYRYPPLYDHHIAQLLALQTDERMFLQVAW